MSLFGADLFGDPVTQRAKHTLGQKFGQPPFTVLNAREGWWNDRKNAWKSLGLKSEESREGIRTYQTAGYDYMAVQTEVSIFDPVLCELVYRWFSPTHGNVLDPFAGGSVRGIVAAMCDRTYTGIDLRPEQVEANWRQAGDILGAEHGPHDPVWIEGDSAAVLGSPGPLPGSTAGQFDFIFSCPPYGDLEVYSDDPADLSTMSWHDFLGAYAHIIGLACDRLRADRFACFVVGDFRDKTTGYYRDFESETIRAFRAAGLHLYNRAVLLTMLGTAPVRASAQFPSGRKLMKTHQDVLVFCKGDWKKAAAACGPLPEEFV